MSSKTEIIDVKSGVTLKRVTLFNGSLPVDEQYTVASKRTPEVKNFESRIDADAYFVAEVARSSQK